MKDETISDTTSWEVCPECGASVPGGSAGCQTLFENLGSRVFVDPRFGVSHDLLVDGYCLQHPSHYCASAKSFAAHLTRLYVGIELGGNPHAYRTIQAWLDGKVDLVKPELPQFKGSITIVEVEGILEPEEYDKIVREYAREVWNAYASAHDLARHYVEFATSFGPRYRRVSQSIG